MKFTFLIENKTDNPGIVAEHGLSVFIEARGKKILLDAGATDLIMDNAKKLGVDLNQADLAVVSHGHYDHTGGFPAFGMINRHAPIYIHRNAFRKSFGMEKGKLEKESCGIRWSREEWAALEERLKLTGGPVEITEDICVTGTVAFSEGFVPTERFYYRDEAGRLAEDDLSHEQALVIREPEGLYVFSGCCHRGAVSALETAKSLFPGERVAAFIGGLHLYSASEKSRRQVVDRMLETDAGRIYPVHCTGIEAICMLKDLLGDRCIVATAGDTCDGR